MICNAFQTASCCNALRSRLACCASAWHAVLVLRMLLLVLRETAVPQPGLKMSCCWLPTTVAACTLPTVHAAHQHPQSVSSVSSWSITTHPVVCRHVGSTGQRQWRSEGSAGGGNCQCQRGQPSPAAQAAVAAQRASCSSGMQYGTSWQATCSSHTPPSHTEQHTLSSTQAHWEH